MKSTLGKELLIRQVLIGFVMLILTSLFFYFVDSFYTDLYLNSQLDILTKEYNQKISRIEKRWQIDELQIKNLFETALILKNNPDDLSILLPVIITNNSHNIYSIIVVKDSDNKIVFQSSAETNLINNLDFAHLENAWFLNKNQTDLYRISNQPIWLGKKGSGTLTLVRQFDKSNLYDLRFPNTDLVLTYNGHPLLQSNDGKNIDISKVKHASKNEVMLNGVEYHYRKLAFKKVSDENLEIYIVLNEHSLLNWKIVSIAFIVLMIIFLSMLWFFMGKRLLTLARKIEVLIEKIKTNTQNYHSIYLDGSATSTLEIRDDIDLIHQNFNLYNNLVANQSFFLEKLLDNISGAILVEDQDHKIWFSNAQFSSMFSLNKTSSEIVGQTCKDFCKEAKIKPKDLDDFYHRIKDLIKFEDLPCEEDIELDNGGVLSRSFNVLKLENKKLYIWIYRDVSAKKQEEQFIEMLKLKSINSARLSALGEMAGGIAHEINNPLMIISGLSESVKRQLIQENGTEDTRVGQLSKIQEVTKRIARIIKGLKSIVRNSENDPFVESSLLQIINDTLEISQEKMKHHLIELILDFPSEDVFLKCRSSQISQVLVNLFNNAIDAISELEKPWIKVEVHNLNDSIILNVIDSGPGIPSHVVSKLMEPFFTTKEVGRGTGLGLSISKGIIEVHGGSFRYDSSSPNTKFTIRLLKNPSQGSQLVPLNKEEAIEAHLNWKNKLVQYSINPHPQLFPQEVANSTCCDLGMWLEQISKTSIFTEDLKSLMLDHDQFHQIAATIVRRINEGDKVATEQSLGANSKFAYYSQRIITEIKKIEIKK